MALCCGGCGHLAEGGASQVTLFPELLVQDVSVLVEAAVDASHLPCFAHPQLPADQPDQPLVVGHQDHPALPQGGDKEPSYTCPLQEKRRQTRSDKKTGIQAATLNLLSALASASMVSMSRWLVGSSRM